ncbi:unnamed protein product [Danaus chrysippus]|uniref:(African queen) hypothetical protein n=1 Tax=Danaus chrysippus TaxID=151541 RepID=A0A8J2W554_9NEOP|nr:unnamed protein product [Danaus chrysippus]CAG9571411.1 unnamed protein product [Danaus chrysippus]CAG9571413.1 unnamed protein product [Danaus chrysippus]CAG9571415.1 unnamed protein product [Danaus chrysippus]
MLCLHHASGVWYDTGRVRRRSPKACTSLLVIHRDPFDVGISAVRESNLRVHARRLDRDGGLPAIGR